MGITAEIVSFVPERDFTVLFLADDGPILAAFPGAAKDISA